MMLFACEPLMCCFTIKQPSSETIDQAGIELLRPRHRPALGPAQRVAPKTGAVFWNRNRPPKRRLPTVGRHLSGGRKWYAKVAPLFGAPKKRPPCRNPSIPVVSVDTEPPFAGGGKDTVSDTVTCYKRVRYCFRWCNWSKTA